jgi:hypothetical protein
VPLLEKSRRQIVRILQCENKVLILRSAAGPFRELQATGV